MKSCYLSGPLGQLINYEKDESLTHFITMHYGGSHFIFCPQQILSKKQQTFNVE